MVSGCVREHAGIDGFQACSELLDLDWTYYFALVGIMLVLNEFVTWSVGLYIGTNINLVDNEQAERRFTVYE